MSAGDFKKVDVIIDDSVVEMSDALPGNLKPSLAVANSTLKKATTSLDGTPTNKVIDLKENSSHSKQTTSQQNSGDQESKPHIPVSAGSSSKESQKPTISHSNQNTLFSLKPGTENTPGNPDVSVDQILKHPVLRVSI